MARRFALAHFTIKIQGQGFDPTAFAVPTLGTQGTAGRNIMVNVYIHKYEVAHIRKLFESLDLKFHMVGDG